MAWYVKQFNSSDGSIQGFYNIYWYLNFGSKLDIRYVHSKVAQ